MSNNQTDPNDDNITFEEYSAPFCRLFDDFGLFCDAYDALMKWPAMKIGATDTHAIAAQIDALTGRIAMIDRPFTNA